MILPVRQRTAVQANGGGTTRWIRPLRGDHGRHDFPGAASSVAGRGPRPPVANPDFGLDFRFISSNRGCAVPGCRLHRADKGVLLSSVPRQIPAAPRWFVFRLRHQHSSWNSLDDAPLAVRDLK